MIARSHSYSAVKTLEERREEMEPLTGGPEEYKGSHLSITAPPPTYSLATSSMFDSLIRVNPPSLALAEDMAMVGREMGRKGKGRRLVNKTGECNVSSKNVMRRHRSYMKDIFTTLVDMKWRYHIVLFSSGFLVSWCFFAFLWYIIAYAHGDTVDYHYSNKSVCVDGVFSYHTALLFSIETQHTIGYGTRAISDECWYAAMILMIQSCLGTFVQALITGLIFAKISRPKGRAKTILFSEKAVICKRDNEYFLLFRVADMRRSHIIGTSIRAMLVKNRLTAEGESIPLCQYCLALESETSRNDCFAFLVWPLTVVHKIDSTSPLWELSAARLYQDHFEIIVILEGTIESTGSLTQVRTSYIPQDVRWGERLAPLMTYQGVHGKYEIDYGQFHETIPMQNMQTCSAKENYEMILNSGGALLDTPEHEKDFPFSFTAPAIREGQRKHNTIQNIFHKKSKHNPDLTQSQATIQSDYVTVDGITKRHRNQNDETITKQQTSGESDMTFGSSASTMRSSRKRGSKRPLWFDKATSQSASKIEGSFRSARRRYLSDKGLDISTDIESKLNDREELMKDQQKDQNTNNINANMNGRSKLNDREELMKDQQKDQNTNNINANMNGRSQTGHRKSFVNDEITPVGIKIHISDPNEPVSKNQDTIKSIKDTLEANNNKNNTPKIDKNTFVPPEPLNKDNITVSVINGTGGSSSDTEIENQKLSTISSSTIDISKLAQPSIQRLQSENNLAGRTPEGKRRNSRFVVSATPNNKLTSPPVMTRTASLEKFLTQESVNSPNTESNKTLVQLSDAVSGASIL